MDRFLPPVPARRDLLGPPSGHPFPLPPPLQPWQPVKKRGRSWGVMVSLIVVLSLVVGAVGTTFHYDPSQHTGEYSFIEKVNGLPARWDPCTPIHYVVNLANAPVGSLVDVTDAVRAISAASGITFVYDGPTDEVPEPGRQPYEPDLYPHEWAPVIIGWVDPSTSGFGFEKDKEGRPAIGIGGPIWSTQDPAQFVSGFVAINDKEGYPEGFGSPYVQGATLMHELGHVLGLGHVKAQGELMEFAGGGMATFGPGDLEGLQKVGRPAGCLPKLPVP